jgi:hypothetical protein
MRTRDRTRRTRGDDSDAAINGDASRNCGASAVCPVPDRTGRDSSQTGVCMQFQPQPWVVFLLRSREGLALLGWAREGSPSEIVNVVVVVTFAKPPGFPARLEPGSGPASQRRAWLAVSEARRSRPRPPCPSHPVSDFVL